MPIINMTSSREEAEKSGINVRDISDSYRSSLGKGSWESEEEFEKRRAEFKLFLYDTFTGLCIKDWERNGHDDSDWYMLVWNWEKMEPETHEFASTRGWSYPCYGSKPDATPEVMAAYEAWEKEQRRLSEEARREREAKTPAKGKTLRVVKGRKIPQGTVGECVWYGPNSFSRSRYAPPSYRVGIRVDGQVVFTDAANVEVVR